MEEVCLERLLLVDHVVSTAVVAVRGDELGLLLLLQEFLFSVVGCLGSRLSLQLQLHGLRSGRASRLKRISTTLRRILSQHLVQGWLIVMAWVVFRSLLLLLSLKQVVAIGDEGGILIEI